MNASRRGTIGVALVFLLIAATTPGQGAGTIEGCWVLVEQHYADGQSNLVAETPLHLEFGRETVGRIWAGEDRGAALGWPAFMTDAGPVPVDVAERVIDLGAGEVRARYTVRPSKEDDLVLEVIEAYRLEPGGGMLSGTMEVRFTGGETNRGGFTLHRRFRRQP
jgi:hypothetical protein